MNISRLFPLGRLVLALAVTTVSGCSTLQYRSVQSRFNAMVRADNERFTTPFTDVASGYLAVAHQLTPEYIAGLDPKLRPNAWTLRSYSMWRGDELPEAISNSLEGLAEINRQRPQSPNLEGSRDSILLTMLPGLVEDTRLRQRLIAKGPPDVASHYDDYAAKFRTALRALAEAKEKSTPATPVEVIYYWDYQCWRVLQNWLFTIGKLPLDKQAEANSDADGLVKAALANAGLESPATLPKAIDAVENDLPEAHPYHQLIDLERQR